MYAIGEREMKIKTLYFLIGFLSFFGLLTNKMYVILQTLKGQIILDIGFGRSKTFVYQRINCNHFSVFGIY